MRTIGRVRFCDVNTDFGGDPAGWHGGVAAGKFVGVLLSRGRGEDSFKGGSDECCVARREGRVCWGFIGFRLVVLSGK